MALLAHGADLFWLIDSVLFLATLLLAGTILSYSWRKEVLGLKRIRGFAEVKKNLQDLLLLGPATFKNSCSTIVDKMTTQQFLEIVRTQEPFFSNDVKEPLKDCLRNSPKIVSIGHTARTSKNKWKRIEAIVCLGYAGAPTAAEILEISLRNKDEDICYFSMLALGELKNKPAAAILLDFLGRHVFSGHKIVSLLESFPPTIVPEIVTATESPDPLVRFWAVKLLSKFKPGHEVKKVMRLTSDPAPDVRAAACECLGNWETKESRDVLLTCLRDDAWFVRMHAVRSLAKIFGTECIPELAPLLLEDRVAMVKESVKAIMVTDIKRAMPFIEKYLASGDAEAKKYCVGALVDSGVISQILKEADSPTPRLRDKAHHLLENLIRSHTYFGLKRALEDSPQDSQKRILDWVRTLDFDLAESIKPK